MLKTKKIWICKSLNTCDFTSSFGEHFFFATFASSSCIIYDTNTNKYITTIFISQFWKILHNMFCWSKMSQKLLQTNWIWCIYAATVVRNLWIKWLILMKLGLATRTSRRLILKEHDKSYTLIAKWLYEKTIRNDNEFYIKYQTEISYDDIFLFIWFVVWIWHYLQYFGESMCTILFTKIPSFDKVIVKLSLGICINMTDLKIVIIQFPFFTKSYIVIKVFLWPNHHNWKYNF